MWTPDDALSVVVGFAMIFALCFTLVVARWAIVGFWQLVRKVRRNGRSERRSRALARNR